MEQRKEKEMGTAKKVEVYVCSRTGEIIEPTDADSEVNGILLKGTVSVANVVGPKVLLDAKEEVAISVEALVESLELSSITLSKMAKKAAQREDLAARAKRRTEAEAAAKAAKDQK